MKASPPRLPILAPASPSAPPHLRPFALTLALLLLIFGLRVAGQVVQWLGPVSFLPPFSAWHSSLLPYPLLLGLQLGMLATGALVTAGVARGRIRPNPRWAAPLLSLGCIYFAAMAYRLGYALGPAARGGFAQPIPAFFHLVIAAWVIALGLYHHRSAPTAGSRPNTGLMPWMMYPGLIAASLLLHHLLLPTNLGLFVSTYVPVGLAAVAITLLERYYPHRAEWKPDHHDVANDLTFMVLVQILLPKVLTFLLAVTVLRWVHHHDIAVSGWWPHRWPVLAQAALMLLSADFLRYWLHRGSHEWSPWLWRFHAVHHSPPKLYWVNVGRFHPLEKALQFLFDAAPFIILGVSEHVLALYFVFYAVNGFFQHCNAEARLGLLNYIISGPELHRWHHSREIRESNKNYGNNIILWDLLFGSYFLPKDRQVDSLGLRNRAYPLSFPAQLRTPFIKGLDQEQP